MENVLKNIEGFDWDNGNINKNEQKHEVSKLECEEIFFNQPMLIFPDKNHSQKEDRYYALGRNSRNRKLFVVFTVRNNKIRIISARDMSKKEKKIYETA